MLAPGTSIGRYEIKRRLAEGGMAEVYLAQATGPEGFAKDVVIKVVRAFLSSDQQFIDMFINEARLSSRLNHANVVQIFDFGKHEQSYFIAMEYVRGTSLFDLRKRCRDRGIPFPPTLVAEIGAQVARGLQYAHSLSDKGKPLGIVHRDVTPHNVLLSFDGAVKLTDFGIAKASTTHTAPGVLKGKFAYMAPEQARGEMVDSRTDIFALGVVLWEMLTGGRLFDGDSELAVLRAVQSSLIAPPSRLNPEVPNELSDIVLKALSRPPAERYQSAFEFDKALGTFVLRAAKSVEDTSVSLFLQQVYADDIAAEEQPMTPIAVPAVQRGVVPQASSFGSGDTLAVDRSSELARGRATPGEGAPSHQPVGVRTEQLQAIKAPGATDPAGRAELGTDVIRGPRRTDPLPSLSLGATAPLPSLVVPIQSGRTDQLPGAYQPQQGTDVVQRPDKRTDSERRSTEPLQPDDGTLRIRDSVKAEAHKRIAEIETERAGAKTKDPTVLKPRSISLDMPAEHSAPTLAAEPSRQPRSPMVLVASVVAAVVVLGGGGWALTRTPTVEPTPTEPVKPPVAEVKAPVAVEPQPVQPAQVAEPVIDAGVAVAALDPKPPLEAVVVPKPVEAKPEVKVEAKPVAVAPRMGLLNVKAIPFAEILIDGKKSGEVQGTRQLKIPVGKHKVTLQHPKRVESFDVVVDGKAPADVSFNVNQ
ncbi:MAG: protein kinase [Archangiaceae bacterium]|nr:protein kinase [Archangiaceae bacterium]